MKTLLISLLIVLSYTINTQTNSHLKWDELLQKHVSSKGNVNYQGFKTDEKLLDNYLEFLSENSPKENSSKSQKLAYWINAYNAFTVKLIINNYPIKSIKDIKQPWDKKFITIGNEKLSLNHIEHEILRKMNEPRIHFAINCASISCPKLLNKAYTASHLETQLNTVTTNFIQSDENNISEKKIEISKLFSWFKSDFKQDGTLIDFLNNYTKVTIHKKAKVKFKDYNWNLNE